MATPYTLDPGEKIIRRVNRHWADLVPIFASAALILIADLFGITVYGHLQASLSFLPPTLVFVLFIALLAVVVLMIASGYSVYQRNYLLVTNVHIINVQQNGLFNQLTEQIALPHILDVSGTRSGLFATILDYGDIDIKTEGQHENCTFRTAPHPQQLADELLQVHEDFLKSRGGSGQND